MLSYILRWLRAYAEFLFGLEAMLWFFSCVVLDRCNELLCEYNKCSTKKLIKTLAWIYIRIPIKLYGGGFRFIMRLKEMSYFIRKLLLDTIRLFNIFNHLINLIQKDITLLYIPFHKVFYWNKPKNFSNITKIRKFSKKYWKHKNNMIFVLLFGLGFFLLILPSCLTCTCTLKKYECLRNVSAPNCPRAGVFRTGTGIIRDTRITYVVACAYATSRGVSNANRIFRLCRAGTGLFYINFTIIL